MVVESCDVGICFCALSVVIPSAVAYSVDSFRDRVSGFGFSASRCRASKRSAIPNWSDELGFPNPTVGSAVLGYTEFFMMGRAKNFS